LTPNGTADRSATNFDRKIFEGKNFVMPKAVFSVSSGFHWFIFSNKNVRKNYGISNFLGMLCMLLKISFDLRSPEIFEELENLYPMFLHSFRVPASTFEIENFDIPIFVENCSLFYLIKSILRS
jgi:hypothetical protein